jgi:hypothetical protein
METNPGEDILEADEPYADEEARIADRLRRGGFPEDKIPWALERIRKEQHFAFIDSEIDRDLEKIAAEYPTPPDYDI